MLGSMARHAALWFLVVAGFAAPAFADLPPAADDCTLEKQCKDGATCPALGGVIDADCAAQMGKSGMALKCQQEKAGVAKAVYCKQGKRGCFKSTVASSRGDSEWILAFAALAALGYRRCRRAS